MSLYGGIKFTAAELEAAALKDSQNSASSSKLKAIPSKPDTASKPLQKVAKPSTAVLAFAPRIKQPKIQTQPSRPVGNYTAAQVIEKKPDLVGDSSGSGTPTGHGPGMGSGSGNGMGYRGAKEEEVVFGQDGKALARAPAMTLSAGATGEARVKGVKRTREEEKQRKKNNKKKKQQQQQWISNFKPEEMYDPNRPNDLGEYQAYRKRARAEKRAELVAEKLKRERGGDSGDSSYYTDSEEEAPRRDAPKMFAPPRLYSPPPSIAPRSQVQPPPPEPSAYSVPPPPPPASGLSDDPYARRLAMTMAQTQTQGPPPNMPNFLPPPQPSFAPSLYPPQTQIPPVQSTGTGIPGFGNYGQSAPSPPSPFVPYPTSAPPPPPAFVPPASSSGGASADAAGVAAAKSLEERRAAAAAIAARFAALAGGSASVGGPSTLMVGAPSFAPAAARPPPIPREEETGTFAEKMMKRWGHVEGSGIGARSDGIVHALSAEHASAPLSTAGLSKRQIAKQKAALANSKKRKWVQAPNARGKIINANEDLRAAEEKDRLGEASRVVCLTGLVEGEEEVDEELADEVGGECSKWGIVERVLLHMVEPPPVNPGECLRVFVVYSGLAGAWRATKELDGRFFGGKKIGVKYFNEDKFNAGDRDGPIV